MADKLRVVRATGASGPVLLSGIYTGISKRPADQYNKGKQPVYVPEVSSGSGFDALGLATVETPGYVDLDPTIEVQRMLRRTIGDGSRGQGSIVLLTGNADVSNSGIYDDSAVTAQGAIAGAELLTGAARLTVTGSILSSLDPVDSQLHVRLAAQLLGVTGGATKDTSAAPGDNLLTLSLNGGMDRNFVVTVGGAVTNAVLARELMQAFAAVGYGPDMLWVDLDGGTASSGILTLAGQPNDGDQVLIDTKTYTFQTVLTNVDGNVFIGGSASITIDNLIAAITLGADVGVAYAALTTLHPTVTAAAGALDTMDATAKATGVAGDAIATTAPTNVSGNLSWGAVTLESGADGTDFLISSPLGDSLEIVASGLATVLGITPGSDTPTVRGTVSEDDFDTASASVIEVLAANGEYPTGTVAGDYAFVAANNQLAERAVVYDAVTFNAPFAIVI